MMLHITHWIFFKPKNKVFLQNIDNYILKENTFIIKYLLSEQFIGRGFYCDLPT